MAFESLNIRKVEYMSNEEAKIDTETEVKATEKEPDMLTVMVEIRNSLQEMHASMQQLANYYTRNSNVYDRRSAE
jgi:alkylated DNA repair dioxygenase AlkB